MRLIDADALKELFSEVIGHIAQKPEMNGNLEHMIRASAMVIQMIDDAPTVQPEEIALHESCTNCPLYDKDRHSCPRFNKVIPEALRELQAAQPKSCEDAVSREAVLSMIDTYMNKSVELHYLPTSDGIKKLISILPSIQLDTTTYDSNVVKTGKNDGDGTSGDCISKQAALETIRTMQTYKLFAGDDMLLIDQAEAQTELMMLPPAEPERKDAVEKAVAVEAISDELMSRFDVSATYGYDFAEAVINRIEAMAKELERGEQE